MEREVKAALKVTAEPAHSCSTLPRLIGPYINTKTLAVEPILDVVKRRTWVTSSGSNSPDFQSASKMADGSSSQSPSSINSSKQGFGRSAESRSIVYIFPIRPPLKWFRVELPQMISPPLVLCHKMTNRPYSAKDQESLYY